MLNRIIGIVFSVTLSLSVGLILLILLELGDFLDADSRLGLFKITINTLIFLLVSVVPIFIISLLAIQDILPKTLPSAGLVSILYAVWLLVLHKCGDLTQSFNPRGDVSRHVVEKVINEVSIVGITILAILSGVGSISTPYKIFEKYKGLEPDSKDVNQVDINSAIQYFNNTLSLIAKRKSELNKLQVAAGGTVYNLPNDSHRLHKSPKKLSLLHKVQSFANISKYDSEENELIKEIESLESLKNTLYDDLVKLISKYTLQNDQYNVSLERLLYWGNMSLAIYCVYRIINVFLVKLPLLLFYGEDYYNVSSTVILSVFRNLPVSEAQLVNQLSFILSASLFVCSFSNVLTTFKSFSRFFPGHSSSETTKNWLKHLIVAELVGVYVIATALLIRTNLPATLSNQISKILSLSGSAAKSPNASIEEVVFIDNWFDKIFAITCVITSIVIFMKRLLEEDRLNTDSSSYDEESFIEDSGLKLA
ncbi:Abscisic acid G-protein coupled receptor family protein [Candida albicans]|uniref:Abscisic acid G-protein coupled receptor family protein n=1 Tax=Candida albicans TaxID=5476 RepID=A0A8H6BUV7_CANAX|nr:Abscisic acid G-protein coupled receptor family protein [Candida albicans]